MTSDRIGLMAEASCADCGAAHPYLTPDPDGRMVCEHRYACEARQMLQQGISPEDAAAHAQKPRPW